MNPKHLNVRADPSTGNLWLTEERYRQPIRKLKDITSDALLAIAADIAIVDGTLKADREIKFSDGTRLRVTVEDITNERESTEEVS